VYALDLRGHGDSPRRPGQYLVIDYVSDILSFLESRDEALVVYGHSLGAMVGASVAAKVPDKVSALILEDPPFATMGSRIHNGYFHSYFSALRQFAASTLSVADLARNLAEMRFGPPGNEMAIRLGDLRDAASLRFSAKALKQLDPEVLVSVTEGRWLEGYDQRRILRSIQCPVLILQADEKAGGMLTDEDAELMLDSIPDCTRVRFPGAGHLLHWVETEAVVRSAIAFLESLPGDRVPRLNLGTAL